MIFAAVFNTLSSLLVEAGDPDRRALQKSIPETAKLFTCVFMASIDSEGRDRLWLGVGCFYLPPFWRRPSANFLEMMAHNVACNQWYTLILTSKRTNQQYCTSYLEVTARKLTVHHAFNISQMCYARRVQQSPSRKLWAWLFTTRPTVK